SRPARGGAGARLVRVVRRQPHLPLGRGAEGGGARGAGGQAPRRDRQPLPLPRAAPRQAQLAREREAHGGAAGRGARGRPGRPRGRPRRERRRPFRLGHPRGRATGGGEGAFVIPGRDGDRQGFRDEAMRVDVALDASGAAAYQGPRPASLYVERVGPAGAPTVYYLHGGPGYNSASFREIAGGDLEDLDMIYADQRGAGRSTGDGGSDVALLAADVLAVMDALDVRRAALLAHWFGALVAVRAARTSPERVTRLVLVNPWLSMPQLARDLHAEATGGQGRGETPEGLEDPWALVDEAFGLVNPKVLFDAMQFPSPKSRLFLEHVDAVALSGDVPDEVDDAVWLAEGIHDLRQAVAAGVPVYLLSGRHDRTSYPGQAELVLEAAPGATFALLAAGHYPWIDDEGFAETLKRALTGDLG